MVSDGEMENKEGMKYFKAFFSIKPDQVRETVLVSPIIYPKQFEKIYGKQGKHGKHGKHGKSILSYLVANFKDVTFIKTPMTQSAVSDLVALLPNTSCQRVVFIGAMGGLQAKMKIGDIVISKKAKEVYSFQSIHDETKRKLRRLREKGVIGIDFESQAFFRAARKAKVCAIACYVVTDLPLKKPFYVKKTNREKECIQNSLRNLVSLCLSGKKHEA